MFGRRLFSVSGVGDLRLRGILFGSELFLKNLGKTKRDGAQGQWEMVMWWVCGKWSEKNEILWRVEFACLLAIEEGPSFRKVDGMVIYLWKNLFCCCSLLPQTKMHGLWMYGSNMRKVAGGALNFLGNFMIGNLK